MNQTARGAILIFLLMQITHSSPDMRDTIGMATPFSEYVKFVADERGLPTFWTEQQLEFLWGTSEQQHATAKLRSIEKEYQEFCEASKDVPWKDQWWGEDGCLSIDDWKIVDAMFRSRSMDFEERGLCLVPIMDMANHARHGASNAMFIKGDKKAAWLRIDGKELIEPGEEVTIMYGERKGASETLHSYGFIENNISDARSIYLGWVPPADDELRDAKMEALRLEPGFEVRVPLGAEVDIYEWAGPCVWAMSVNQEDGLRIRSIEDPNGQRQLQASFKENIITDKGQLERLLKRDRLREIFQLRAYSYVQARVAEVIKERQELAEQHIGEEPPEGLDEESLARWRTAERLRALEMELLVRANERFVLNIQWWTERPDVQNFINGRPLVDLPPAHYWEENPSERQVEEESAEGDELAGTIKRREEEWGNDEEVWGAMED